MQKESQFRTYTIPANIDFIHSFPGELAEMNGPASPLAGKCLPLYFLLMPITIFNPSLNAALDKRVAISKAKKTLSLGWALRAWCHSCSETYMFQPDGAIISAYRDFEQYDDAKSPIISTYFSNKGWQIIRQNALIFDWALRDVLSEFTIDIPNTYMYVHQLSDSVGHVDLVETPNFDYTKNIVEQVDYLVKILDQTVLELTKHYNERRNERRQSPKSN